MIKLSKFERLVLANQYRILEHVDPKHAADHADTREAVEAGYAWAINALFEDVNDGLSDEECKLVWRSMAVYSALQQSYAALDGTGAIDEWQVAFPGFDGNSETMHMAYTEHVVQKEHRFTQLKLGEDGFNSHLPMIDRYGAMIREWERLGGGSQLTEAQMQQILSH